MRKDILFLIVLGMLLQAGAVSATTDLNPLEKSYRPGDYVNLGGIFTNNYTESRSVEIEQVLLHEGLDSMPGFSDESVKPGRIALIRGLGFTVQGTTDSGIYTYMATVYEDGVPIESASVSFEITGARKRFEDARVRVCGSQECRTFKSIFAMEAPAYIRVFDSEGATLRGYIEDDFGFRKDLNFKAGTAEFKLDKTGHFRVVALAEREGYETYEMETGFYVIEGNYVLTDFFPMVKWIYQILFIVIILSVFVTIIISLLKGKKNRDKLREWLRQRSWREKEDRGLYRL
jgi:hypothetical protein